MPGSSSRVREHRGGALDQPSLVGVGQPRRQVSQRHPGHLGDFHVRVGEFPPEGTQQEMVHRLVDPAVFSDEPVVDAAQGCHYRAVDSGLLSYLAHGRLLHRLAVLDVALGQRPQQPPPPIQPTDHGSPSRLGVHDQPTRRGLRHGPHAGSPPLSTALGSSLLGSCLLGRSLPRTLVTTGPAGGRGHALMV